MKDSFLMPSDTARMITKGMLAFAVTFTTSAAERTTATSETAVRGAAIEVRKEKLISFCTALVERRPEPSEEPVLPTKSLYVMMNPSERILLIIGVDRLCDRLAEAGCLDNSDLAWAREALSVLRTNASAENAALNKRLHDIPVSTITTLTQLNQTESLLRSAHPQSAPSDAGDSERFDHSRIKKALKRQGLAIMRRPK